MYHMSTTMKPLTAMKFICFMALLGLYLAMAACTTKHTVVPLAEFVTTPKYKEDKQCLQGLYYAILHPEKNAFSLAVGPYVLAYMEPWKGETTENDLKLLLSWMNENCTSETQKQQAQTFHVCVKIIVEYFSHKELRDRVLTDKEFETHPFVKLMRSLTLEVVMACGPAALNELKTLLDGNDGGIPSESRYIIIYETLLRITKDVKDIPQFAQLIHSYLYKNNMLTVLLLNLLTAEAFNSLYYNQRKDVLAFTSFQISSESDRSVRISIALPLINRTTPNTILFRRLDNPTPDDVNSFLSDYMGQPKDVERLLYKLPLDRSVFINAIANHLPKDQYVAYVRFYMSKSGAMALQSVVRNGNLNIFLGKWIMFDDSEADGSPLSNVALFWSRVSSIDELDKIKALQVIFSEKYANKWAFLEQINAVTYGECLKDPNAAKTLGEEFQIKVENNKLVAEIILIDAAGTYLRRDDLNNESYANLRVSNHLLTLIAIRQMVSTSTLEVKTFYERVFLTATPPMVSLAMNMISDKDFSAVSIQAKKNLVNMKGSDVRFVGIENVWAIEVKVRHASLKGYAVFICRKNGAGVSAAEINQIRSIFVDRLEFWESLVFEILTSYYVTPAQKKAIYTGSELSKATTIKYLAKKGVELYGGILQVGGIEFLNTNSPIEQITELWTWLSKKQRSAALSLIVIRSDLIIKPFVPILIDLLDMQEFYNLTPSSRLRLLDLYDITFDPRSHKIIRGPKSQAPNPTPSEIPFKTASVDQLRDQINTFVLSGIVIAQSPSETVLKFSFLNGVTILYTDTDSEDVNKTRTFIESFLGKVALYHYLLKAFDANSETQHVKKFKSVFYPHIPYSLFTALKDEEITSAFLATKSDSVVREMEWPTLKKILTVLKTSFPSDINWNDTVSFISKNGPIGRDAEENPPDSVLFTLFIDDASTEIKQQLMQIVEFLSPFTSKRFEVLAVPQQWVYFTYAGQRSPGMYTGVTKNDLINMATFVATDKRTTDLSVSLSGQECKNIVISGSAYRANRVYRTDVKKLLDRMRDGEPSALAGYPTDINRRRLAIGFLEQVLDKFALFSEATAPLPRAPDGATVPNVIVFEKDSSHQDLIQGDTQEDIAQGETQKHDGGASSIINQYSCSLILSSVITFTLLAF